jgi:hypothetical protein
MIGKFGLGDACTPNACAGPYDNSIYNYDYWLTQGTAAGVVQTTSGSQTQTISPSQIQAAMNQQQGASDCLSYEQLQYLLGVQNCGALPLSDQYECSQGNVPKLNQISALQIQNKGCVRSVTSPIASPNQGVNTNSTNTNTSQIPIVNTQQSTTPTNTTNIQSGYTPVDTLHTPITPINDSRQNVDKVDGTAQGASDLFKQTYSLFGFDVPIWMLGVGAVGIVAIMSLGGRR